MYCWLATLKIESFWHSKGDGSMRDRLLVLWTSGDRTVAMNMVCMYTLNSKINGWWEEVTLLIWGASGDLLVNDAKCRRWCHCMQTMCREYGHCGKAGRERRKGILYRGVPDRMAEVRESFAHYLNRNPSIQIYGDENSNTTVWRRLAVGRSW